jgi:hypothetical protein
MLRPTTLFCVAFGILVSCQNSCNPFATETLSPEQVVETYLNVAFNMKSVGEKKKLMSVATGSLKAALSAASDETIEAAYIKRRYNLESYSVIQRRDRTPRETEITFQLTYKDLGNTDAQTAADQAPKVTTENTVALIKEQGVWLIREVLGNKTTIDFPLAEAAQIKAKPGDFNPPVEESEEGVPEDGSGETGGDAGGEVPEDTTAPAP